MLVPEKSRKKKKTCGTSFDSDNHFTSEKIEDSAQKSPPPRRTSHQPVIIAEPIQPLIVPEDALTLKAMFGLLIQFLLPLEFLVPR